jgi:hypothetical protein
LIYREKGADGGLISADQRQGADRSSWWILRCRERPKQAEYWCGKSEQDKLAAMVAEKKAQEQRRQQQLQPNARRRNLQGPIMLGLLLGTLASDSDSGPSAYNDSDERYRRGEYQPLQRRRQSRL